MANKPVPFSDLERAYWRFVDQNCPHPIHSRHRYTWLRANRAFDYNGILWERASTTRASEAGSAAPGTHLVLFTAANGVVVQDWLKAGSIFRAA